MIGWQAPDMDAWMIITLFVGGAWLVAGVAVGMAGGFDLIRRIELSKELKTAKYWITLLVIYPTILVRAAFRAMLETITGGAR
jgi:hypothetical protein